MTVNKSGTNAPLSVQLDAYKDAMWGGFAFGIIGALLAIAFLRGVGIVGHKTPAPTPTLDEEKTAANSGKSVHSDKRSSKRSSKRGSREVKVGDAVVRVDDARVSIGLDVVALNLGAAATESAFDVVETRRDDASEIEPLPPLPDMLLPRPLSAEFAAPASPGEGALGVEIHRIVSQESQARAESRLSRVSAVVL